jgi:flagellin-like protein
MNPDKTRPRVSGRFEFMNKKSWSRRYDSEGVSPVIATILLVGITVVLAATLYVMVFGFSNNSTNTPPVATFTKSSVSNGFKFTFTPFSKDTVWGDLFIVLIDGSGNTATFDNMTTLSLSTGSPVTVSFGSRTLGALSVFMNVTDQAGNGYANQGDSYSLTTSGGIFSNAVTYEVFLMHNPTGSQINSMSFLGD